MRRLLVLALALAVVAVLAAVVFPRGWGPHGGPNAGTDISWPIGTAVAVPLGVAAVAIFAYALIYPEIPEAPITPEGGPPKEFAYPVVDTFEGVLRVLEPEERQVCKALRNHGSYMTQKEIGDVSGFSKVKTHRIVSRLASRRIVMVEKVGKVNRVRLADWVVRPEGAGS